MSIAIKAKNDIEISEEQFTEITLKSLEENKEGITEYPILNFDKRALRLLSAGVEETLKQSNIKPAGGVFYKFTKRTFDIVFSFICILLLFIPMAILALVIYISDRGNPFFSQVRMTEKGKTFKMYKFRSMCIDAEEKFSQVQKENQSDGLAFKSDNDPRITKIGKLLRKTSIDEFPQLFNILKGDMSFIGPRPPLPREVVLYEPEHMNRLMVKGGLSCICQVEGRSDMEFDKWVETDIKYIETRSIHLDISLFVRTIGAVLVRRGAK